MQRWFKIQRIYFRRWKKALQELWSWDAPRYDRGFHRNAYRRPTMNKEYWRRLSIRYWNKLREANRKVEQLWRASGRH